MDRQYTILDKIENFFHLKLDRLEEQEELSRAIERRIKELISKMTLSQLLSFFNSVNFQMDNSEVNILSLLKGKRPDGSELPLLPEGGRRKEGSVYKMLFDRLNKRAIQLLWNLDEEKLAELGIDKEDLANVKRIQFMEAQDVEEEDK